MAKYDVTYKCGHTHKLELYGKIDDRINKIAWLEENALCPECFKKQKLEEAISKANDLPLLEGSEKQIAWAMTIRQEWIERGKSFLERKGLDYNENLNTLLKNYKNNKESFDNNEERNHPVSDLWFLLLAHIERSAKFFIENR